MKPTFDALFQQATATATPLPYQERLALGDSFPTLLDIPTGLGKTAAAILGWVWQRRFAEESIRTTTPRRLVYCLPMRVLVEQTLTESVKWLERLGLLAGSAQWTETDAGGLPTNSAQLKRATDGVGRGYRAEPNAERSNGWASTNGDHGQHPIAVHLLLGGEEKSDWALWPERDAILIGTQDMLLSRAMNRGYAAGRARWPLEFGFLNSDCLWVFDEIQIMDTGLASSLQFDAWRRNLRLRPERDQFPEEKQNHLSRSCHSLWMSATMAKHWLGRAVDWSPQIEMEWSRRHQLVNLERTDTTLRSGRLFQIAKAVIQPPIAALEKPKTKDGRADKADAERKQAEYLKRLADHIGKPQNHAQSGLTLVIVNTVDRARKLYELLKKQESLAQVPIKLIHSRFRPIEREQWGEFLGQKDSTRRILISTQVVEAGVDLSACVLYTELAPWASLVQRFGRCARYPGEAGKVVWLDLDLGKDNQPSDHWAKPYDRPELVAAREKLKTLGDVGLQTLTKIKTEIDVEISGEQAKTLFPYEPRFVPHDKDLFDLFDTTPDLTGADVDISRFIRDGEELDIQVFWREFPSGDTPLKKDRPHRRELCSVPFHRFRELLPALRKAGRIWRRNYRKGWEGIDPRDSEQVYPGQVFLLEKSCGGYDRDLGWTGVPTDRDFDLPAPIEPTKATAQDDEDEADDLSQINAWLTVEEHTRDVCRKLDELLASSGLTESEIKVLRLAARLHDWGKAHKAFQAKLLAASIADDKVQQKLNKQPAAKAPDSGWRKDKIRRPQNDQPDRRRPGFRHELASALAILEALYRTKPDHPSFGWPDGLDKANFGAVPNATTSFDLVDDPLMKELVALSAHELDLLVYLVATHHGKVRMSLRSSPDDDKVDVPDRCPNDKRQARGVRDDDALPSCRIPAADLKTTNETPTVTLSLDLMELGLSPRYGASWRERTQLLLERLGPFQLGYLEALLRASDCRASAEEDERGRESN
jgi:CRISPR-associated endonuclease/helicase Cas3